MLTEKQRTTWRQISSANSQPNINTNYKYGVLSTVDDNNADQYELQKSSRKRRIKKKS